jgi:hypothetical protein
MMDKRPLLIFPTPTTAGRTKSTSRLPKIIFPTREQQIARIGPRWIELQRTLENQTMALGPSPSGTFSEMILVFELAGTIEDFFTAVDRISEMHFLKEYECQFDADEHFTAEGGGPIAGRIFVSMTNQRSLEVLQRLWNIYNLPVEKQRFDTGLAKFRILFDQLRDVRPYSVEDRVRDTGLEEYINELKSLGKERMRFEIEMAYPFSEPKRKKGLRELRRLLEVNDGKLLEGSVVDIRAIGYFACIAEAPMAAFDDLTENTSITFLKASQVMYFRPVGQMVDEGPLPEGVLEELPAEKDEQELFGNPVIALLDGMPLENHEVIKDKLILDDPDNFGENYLATHRRHGTSMASLILNGDLNNQGSKLVRPIYVRPVMKADALGNEYLPDDRLPIDIFHRAVLRMLAGGEGIPPVAPTIKIINLSIADHFRPYIGYMSTWAKLLDWLSWKYKVLFIVSAGNHSGVIKLSIPSSDFGETEITLRQKELLKILVRGNFDRKILTPAEAFNVLTVGSFHHDDAPVDFTSPEFLQRINLLSVPSLVSPHSRFGWGHNKSIKPDILMPGGRSLYRKMPMQRDATSTSFNMEGGASLRPPGNKVAHPGNAGELNHVLYTCGTSNATALATNLAGRLYEVLLELNGNLANDQKIDEKYFSLLIKALLVHGASWGAEYDLLREVVMEMPDTAKNTVKRRTASFLGYGGVDGERIIYCTQHRVTLIGAGQLCCVPNEDAHEFKFPLPLSISGSVIHKKLVATLAWFSPINALSNKYRKAHLYMENLLDNETISLDDRTYDLRQSSKGTVQHQILTGERADTLIEDGHLIIKVNCRQDAPDLEAWEKIPYGLAVTLEVPNSIQSDVYEEIKEKIQERVRPRRTAN